MYTATEKFKIGQEVRLSKQGHKYMILRSCFNGVVCGFGKDIFTVRVKREGRKAIENYHMDFWTVERKP